MRRPLRASIAVVLLLLAQPVAAGDVIINEIMYNSLVGVGGQPVEFVEIINRGSVPVALDGWTLIDDDPLHPPCLLVGTLPPGEILVIPGDPLYFMLQYPGVDNVNVNGFDPGGAGFGLGNAGDTVKLFNALSALEDSVAYDDGGAWPGAPDGNGPSLELINPMLDNDLPTSWDPSLANWGTPGVSNSVYSPDAAPICRDGDRSVPHPVAGESVFVTVTAFDLDGAVDVELFFDLTGIGFVGTPMSDDGLHGDGAAGDSLFGAQLPGMPDGALVRYYCRATDALAQGDNWPNDAPLDFAAYTVGHTPPELRITEVLASNVTGPIDETGAHEDWIELHNAGAVPLNLGGLFLSDDPDASRMWELPAFVLAPGGYLLIWADDDTGDGLLHANFKLSADGEWVGLFDANLLGNALIDGFAFGPLGADRSAGPLTPGDNHPDYLAQPTPGAVNTDETFSAVCINEFLSTSTGGGIDDWVELYNRSDLPVDIGGWMLSDDSHQPAKYVIPLGAQLPAGGHLLLDEAQLGFGFDADGGDVIYLAAADSVTGLDFHAVGPQIPDRSFGRSPDGAGTWDILAAQTPGAPNSTTVDAPAGIPPCALRYAGSWPNPFNPSTRIRFALGRDAHVSIAVHAPDGRRLRRLHDGPLAAGVQELVWDGRDDRGRALASGLYLVRIASEDEVERGKLLMVK